MTGHFFNFVETNKQLAHGTKIARNDRERIENKSPQNSLLSHSLVNLEIRPSGGRGTLNVNPYAGALIRLPVENLQL